MQEKALRPLQLLGTTQIPGLWTETLSRQLFSLPLLCLWTLNLWQDWTSCPSRLCCMHILSELEPTIVPGGTKTSGSGPALEGLPVLQFIVFTATFFAFVFPVEGIYFATSAVFISPVGCQAFQGVSSWYFFFLKHCCSPFDCFCHCLHVGTDPSPDFSWCHWSCPSGSVGGSQLSLPCQVFKLDQILAPLSQWTALVIQCEAATSKQVDRLEVELVGGAGSISESHWC